MYKTRNSLSSLATKLRSIPAIMGTILMAVIVPTHAVTSGETAYGTDALKNSIANENTAIGKEAMYFNSTGESNVAVGGRALWSNTTGRENTAIGLTSLAANTTGNGNTAIGFSSLNYNSTGSYNTANGWIALLSNRTGDSNTATGVAALLLNETGSGNTATGHNALLSNINGHYNVAIGNGALNGNSSGGQNTANGYLALSSNTTGDNNTASGAQSLSANQTGWGNTGIGFQALGGMISGHNNVALGYKAGLSLTGSNNIAIMNSGVAGENNVTRIGQGQSKAFVAGISGVKVSGGVQVYINADGQLGTLTSSQRFKQDIKSIENASDKLQQLRPVSFLYKDGAESGEHTLQYGLIAEEVAKVYPELVQYDKEGKPFTVYYHLLTPLLLNEVQKNHAHIESQQTKLDVQQSEIANLNQQLTTQRTEMLTLMQQQQLQHATEMAALQQKLNQLDMLVQASGSNQEITKKVAVLTTH